MVPLPVQSNMKKDIDRAEAITGKLTDRENYKVLHQLADWGLVDLDLGCSTILPSQFWQNPICLSRIGQIAELLRSK